MTTSSTLNSIQKAKQALEQKNNQESTLKTSTEIEKMIKKSIIQKAAEALANLNMQQTSPSTTVQPSQAYNNLKNLGEEIKTERMAQGLTQRDLAIKARMSQGSVTRAEKHGWVSIHCIIRLANALGKNLTIK